MITWLRNLMTPSPGKAPASFTEAVGVTIDQDEDKWRKLTADTKRDLMPLTQRRMQELAVHLWRANPLGNQLIELPVAFLLAEGVSIEVPDEEAQKWINAFWRDPINQMNLKLPKKVRELAIYGEQCWPAFVNEHNGAVRLGYLDPGMIETVVTDPDNAEQPIGIVTVKDRHGQARRYKVIVNGPEDVFSQRTQKIRESFTDGEAFYFTINDLSNQDRGTSDLLSTADWIDAYDHVLFGEIDRMDFLRSFLWDVTLKGATKEEVEERARSIQPPTPGSVRVHNEAEEWKAETPALGAQDASVAARLFRNHILSGRTIPEHWFGGGGDVNRATASEMSEPTQKVLTMRQTTVKYILETVATYVIRQRLKAYYNSEPEQSADPEAYVPTAQFPELVQKDVGKFAAALQAIVIASASAVDRGLLSEESAIKLIALIATRLGLDIDAEEELQTARKEADSRRKRDSFDGYDGGLAADGGE